MDFGSRTMNWLETLSSVVRDKFFELTLNNYVGTQLIEDNVDLHKEVDALLDIAGDIKTEEIGHLSIPKYSFVAEWQEARHFFESCRDHLRETNNRLEKISAALRKHLAKLPLNEEERDLLRGNCYVKKEIEARPLEKNDPFQKDREIEELKNRISFFEEKFESMKIGLKFQSIDLLAKNLYFFNDSLFRIRRQSHHEKQMQMLSHFQKNLSADNFQETPVSVLPEKNSKKSDNELYFKFKEMLNRKYEAAVKTSKKRK